MRTENKGGVHAHATFVFGIFEIGGY